MLKLGLSEQVEYVLLGLLFDTIDADEILGAKPAPSHLKDALLLSLFHPMATDFSALRKATWFSHGPA